VFLPYNLSLLPPQTERHNLFLLGITFLIVGYSFPFAYIDIHDDVSGFCIKWDHLWRLPKWPCYQNSKQTL